MWAVTTSATQTIHVRLLDEPVDVWRPAQAVELGADHYRLSEQPVPDDESWEFLPGDEVVTGRRQSGSESFLAAVGRAGTMSRLRRQAGSPT